MGVAGMDRNIQTLFLISNSFNGFGFGVFLFAFGVGRGTLLGMTSGYIWCIGVGVAMIGLALLGYLGAGKLHRNMLNTYAWLTIGCAALEVMVLVMIKSDVPALTTAALNDLGFQAFFITMICIIVITTMSVLLACALSLQILCHGSGAAAVYRQ